MERQFNSSLILIYRLVRMESVGTYGLAQMSPRNGKSSGGWLSVAKFLSGPVYSVPTFLCSRCMGLKSSMTDSLALVKWSNTKT
jgi:hypothetical protein